jgi:ABC-type nitrate/sulfonate/bicarbonate transport system substrate-binding protein
MSEDDRRIWYTRCPLPTASGIALDAGILQRRIAGIDWSVDAIENAAAPGSRHSHFTHATARLFRQGGNIPPIWARSRGADTALVGIAWTREYQTLLARPASGIRSVADLRGRRLALPVRTSGEIDFWRAMCLRGYDSALRLAGLTLDDVELVELPVHERYIPEEQTGEGDADWMWAGSARARRQQAETFAFVRDEVDVLYASGALGVQLQALLDAVVVVDLGFHPSADASLNNQVPNILTADRTLVRERPDVVAEYLRALNEAAQWARSHADMATRTCAREVGAPEEWIAPSYRNEAADALSISLDDHLVRAVASQKKFLLDHGFITQDFDMAEWLDTTPLELSRKETP